MRKKRCLVLLLCMLMVMSSITGCGNNAETTAAVTTTAETTAAETTTAETTAAETKAKEYPIMSEDTENKALYASTEEGTAEDFNWYRWDFAIDPEMDTVGDVGDGVGTLYFRLYVPEDAKTTKYPLIAVLGGLGSANCIINNFYANKGLDFASETAQMENPAYVLNFNVPFEACVNYEAELEYVYQFGEVIKAISEEYGNVDMNRIYATGMSQGAGWSYELASVQPDLLAAILINAGTTVHTTWGDQCDMQAIADSDVNIYILHGYEDLYIPVNEAYRAFNTLKTLGKTNMLMDITSDGHVLMDATSAEEMTDYMTWIFAQEKKIACAESPELNEFFEDKEYDYSDYLWAGVQVLPAIDGWAKADNYATWIEPQENTTWNQVKESSVAYVQGEGGTGETILGKIRIGDETQTSYDDATKDEPIVTISAGDVAAITVQGYTGAYGDDETSFSKEWSVDWAVLEGSVTDIELTCEASDKPILRPDTVTLANGGGPNVNNSLYNENTLDGKQVYIKIRTAQDFDGDTLKVAIRFTRDLGNGEFASYWHVVEFAVEK